MKNFKINSEHIATAEDKIEISIPSNLKNIKVVEAILNVSVNSVTLENRNFQVDFESIKNSTTDKSWTYVDYLKNVKNLDNLKINISDELQTVIDSDATTLILHFKCNDAHITFDNSTSDFIDIDYISLEEFQNNGSSQNINLEKSGNATINLATGKLNITTPLISSDENVLPISINANYYSVQNDKLKNIGLPNNWNLNVNQFLIKNENDNEKLRFTYIDENGKNQIIEEKYYYIDENNKKIYVNRNQVTVDLDGNLQYNDKEVKTELEAPSGIKLISSIKDFKNSHLVDYEPEELSNIKQQIEQTQLQYDNYNLSYKTNNQQLASLILTKEYLNKQLTAQIDKLAQNEEYLDLQRKLESIRMCYFQTTRTFKDLDPTVTNPSVLEYARDYFNNNVQANNNEPILKQNNITLEMINDLFKYYFENIPIYVSNNSTDKELTIHDARVLANIFSNEASGIYSLGFDGDDTFKGTIKSGEDDLALQKEIYKQIISEETFKSNIKNEIENIINDEFIVTFNSENSSLNAQENEKSYNFDISNIKELLGEGKNINLSSKDLISLNSQIQSLVSTNTSYLSLMKKLKDELDKLNHQKEQYEMQVPVHYLYNEDNIIYGFGKTSDKNTFRLVLITDPYENAVYFTYESLESNRLESIIDSAEKLITFSYKNGLLSTIKDARDREVKFNYDTNNMLHCIVHVDNTKSYFYYEEENELDYARLIAVLNETGLGTLFEYTDNKITKATALSVLNDVTNGKVTYKNIKSENSTDAVNLETLISSTLQTCEDYKLKDAITFKYENCKSTTLTNSKNKSVTYLFDKEGRVRTIYENGFDESNDNSQINFHAKDFTYQDNKISKTISPLPYSQNYLSDVVFKEDAKTIEYGFYLGEEDSVCSATTIPYSYEVNAKYYTIASSDTTKSMMVSMSDDKLAMLNDEISKSKTQEDICSHHAYVVSGWAKSGNASFTLTDEKDKDVYADYIKNRKFELRVKVKYESEDENKENSDTFITPFDWRNTEWQYCATAILLRNDTILSIECSIDYSENTGDLIFTDLDFKQADFEITDYDSFKRPIKNYSAHSNFITTYDYADDETTNPCKQTVTINKNTYITTFEYTKEGKLLRSIDYNGIVKENVYNDQGIVVKTITYHKDEPTNKFYDEKKLDEKGKETASINELGEETASYEYINGTGIVSSSVDENGVKTSYGYSPADTLLETSITANGIENTNTYGYNLDFLTSLKHNDFEIGYDYDEQGRTKQINIAGNKYLSKEYGENEETTTLSSNEVYRQTFNDSGDVLDIYYKSNANDSETKLVENVYDTYGNITISKDLIENNTHTYYYDKFGNTVKETNTQHGQNITIENVMDDDSHSNIKTSTITIGSETLDYIYDREETPDAKLFAISLPGGIEQTIDYDKLQRVKEIQTLDFAKQFTYLKNGDHTTNLISKLLFAIKNETKDNLTYKYDKKGNITEIRENNKLLARYKYDALSRIIREDNSLFNKTYTYSYDAGGNITQRDEYAFTLVENLDFETSTNSFNYSYSTKGWKDQLKEYNGEKFVYDSLGNPTTYRDKTLLWSHGRQLDKFSDVAEYKYNANGIRTSKTINVNMLECNCGKEDCDCNGTFTTSFFLNGNKIIKQHDCCNDLTFYYGADGVTGFHLKNNLVDDDFYYKKNAQN
ncbi:MAG TPA: RHS repeat protein, partial [Candidatus Caccovivens faecavium]|nr:RHS repeat protein [Candidatus Caccovivens faecavium]